MMTGLRTQNSNTNILSESFSHHIGNLIDSVSKTFADKTAIKYFDQRISYEQLAKRINGLTSELIQNGVKSGDKVGVYFLNHPDFVVAFVAILKVGACVVPINPLLKFNEINHILSDSESTFLIAHEKLVRNFSGFENVLSTLTKVFVLGDENDEHALKSEDKIICLDSHRLESKNSEVFENQSSESKLAVLVYTSGTTGNPKGAMLTHDNLLSAIEMKRDRFVVKEDDCIIAVLPLCHIYGMVVVMLGTLVEGASLSILESFDPEVALGVIENDKVTILPAVPAMYQFMSMVLDKQSFDTSSLRYCVTGGANIDPGLWEKVEKQLQAPVLEGYALTEVACVATLTPLGESSLRKRGSCGPAIDGVELKVLDENKKVLPPGPENVGEVAIGGPHVMQGYYKSPQATANVFHKHLFLTGDLGYLDEDGYLYICGRSKELIIRGGQNIYPREVECAILSHKEIEDAGVVGVPDKYMGERVKAVIVLKQGSDLSEAEIDQYLKERLAPYKVPRIYEFRETLPRNSTGKLLKRQLID